MKQPLKEDSELIASLKKDNRATFKEIYIFYYPRLYNFAKEYIIYPEDAKDIMHNVFTKLWLNRYKLDDNSRIGAWLLKITRNECLSLLAHRKIVRHYRYEKKQNIFDINYNALSGIELSDNTLFDILDIFETTLDNMPPQCRKVFELSRFRNMSNKTIANQLSISVKTVESHMSKAFKILLNALSEYL